MAAFAHTAPTHSPNVWTFPLDHRFTIDDVPFAHVGSDPLMIKMRSVETGLTQIMPQPQFDILVRKGRVDPCLEENDPDVVALAVRDPAALTMSDLPEDEQRQILVYHRLCRTLYDMRDRGEVSFTTAGLRSAIPRIMADIRLQTGFDVSARSYNGSQRTQKSDAARPRIVSARKTVQVQADPAPSTVIGWIKKLEATRWDPMQIRDRRKGRCCPKGSRIADPTAVEILREWVPAYCDRSRPSQIGLYRLMLGGPEFNEDASASAAARHAGVADKTFHAENMRRASMGLPSLTPPSLSTFRRAIRALNKFDVHVARYGLSAAKKLFKIAGKHELATRPGELVGIDSWRIQQMSKVMKRKSFDGLPRPLLDVVKKLRLSLTIAKDAATKCVLGLQLAYNPNADTVLRTVRMISIDKSGLAAAAGCRSTWAIMCSVSTIAMDGGPENIDVRVRAAIRDTKAQTAYGMAGAPDERGDLERAFRTFDIQFAPLFQGRTFSNVVDKGDYKPEDVAEVLIEVLQPALLRYVVDFYHNAPHSGLAGQTPIDAWIEGTRTYGVLPPPSPSRLRAAFGLTVKRRIQNRGIVVAGLEYANEELAALRRQIGQGDVLVKIDTDDLGAISVRADRRGSSWITVPCRSPMTGVTTVEWFATAGALRRRNADVSALRQDVMLAALADIRRMGIQSALDAGLGPSVMPQDEIDAHAKHLFRHFRIVDPDVRGGAVDFSDAVLVPITDEMPTGVGGDDSVRKNETAAPTTRRGTRKAFSVGEDE